MLRPWYAFRPRTQAFDWVVQHVSYKAAPEVAVRDLRLSIIFILIRVGVLLYVVIYVIVLSHAYAEFESVEARASIIPGVSTNLTAGPVPAFCNNPDYNFGIGAPAEALQGLYLGPNITCRLFDRAVHVSTPIPGTLLASTALIFAVPPSTLVSRFTIGAEALPVTIVHSYRTHSGRFSGVNPHTVLRDSSGAIIRDFPAGLPIQTVPLSTFLAAAGVSMDHRNPTPPMPQEQWPFYRGTGAVLFVRMAYSNLRSYEWPSPFAETRADMTVNVLEGQIGSADPVFMLDPEFGPTTCIRTGIRLEVSASGTLGGITALALVLALVQGFVLLSVGDIVVRWFADRLYRRHQHYVHLTKHEVSPDSRVDSPPFWSGEPFSAKGAAQARVFPEPSCENREGISRYLGPTTPVAETSTGQV